MKAKDELRELLYEVKMNRLQGRGTQCQALLSRIAKMGERN